MSGLEFTSVPHQRTFLKQLNTSVAFPFTGALPPPSQPPLPSSTFSITGNNRPPSFITSWRWFPHGATRSLCCQPASQHTASLQQSWERIKSLCRLPRFLIVLLGGGGWRGGGVSRLGFHWKYPRLTQVERSLSPLQSHLMCLSSLPRRLNDKALVAEYCSLVCEYPSHFWKQLTVFRWN